jgi:hypothetical protein
VGVSIEDGGQNEVFGNLIGMNPAGTKAVYNSFGVVISASRNNIVGGLEAGKRNVISGNGDGIRLSGASGLDGNQVIGNYIGLNPAGTAAIPNSTGVTMVGDFSAPQTIDGNTIAYNVISGNTSQGVDMAAEPGAPVNQNELIGNIIGLNAAGDQPIPNDTGVLIRAFVGGDASDNTLWADVSGSAPNIISGNTDDGLAITGEGAHDNAVYNNLIGTDATGQTAIGNSDGVSIGAGAHNNYLQGNTIAGNGRGVWISAETSRNAVLLNKIGTNSDGDDLGNTDAGIAINDSTGNFIGSRTAPTSAGSAAIQAAAAGGNIIRYNDAEGIRVVGTPAQNNPISGNSIDDNGGLGIDLIDGGNSEIPAPVLTSATNTGADTHVLGSVSGTANSAIVVEFFASPGCDGSGGGEGRDYLGTTTVNTDGTGAAAIDEELSPGAGGGQRVTATATNAIENTSQFSNCVTASGPTPTPSPTPSVTPTPSPTPTPTSSPGIRGDADCDNNVDLDDMIAVLSELAGVDPGAPCDERADADCDDDVDSEDALRIVAHVAGVAMTPPVGCGSLGV